MSTERHASRFAPSTSRADGRIDLIGLDRAELTAVLPEIGAEPFRARQLWHWLYHRGATDFAEMTSLAKDFRSRLGERFVVGRPLATADTRSEDGTRKWLLRFSDGQEV